MFLDKMESDEAEEFDSEHEEKDIISEKKLKKSYENYKLFLIE